MADRYDRAADMLVHYFRTAFTRTGALWTEDKTAEVTEIIDNLRAEVGAETCRLEGRIDLLTKVVQSVIDRLNQ